MADKAAADKGGRLRAWDGCDEPGGGRDEPAGGWDEPGGGCDAGRGGCENFRARGGADEDLEGRPLGVRAVAASSGARCTSYFSREAGSTARQPSSRSSIEKPLIGADSPRCSRAACNAFCHDSASTESDSLSALPSDVTSTSQRMIFAFFRLCQRLSRPTLTSGPHGRSTRAGGTYSALSPSAGRSLAA